MKVYSDKFGPVQYFRCMGFLTFAIPYAWSFPKYWPVCIAATVTALWFLDRLVKKEEPMLREAKFGDPRTGKVVVVTGVLMFANAALVRSL